MKRYVYEIFYDSPRQIGRYEILTKQKINSGSKLDRLQKFISKEVGHDVMLTSFKLLRESRFPKC